MIGYCFNIRPYLTPDEAVDLMTEDDLKHIGRAEDFSPSVKAIRSSLSCFMDTHQPYRPRPSPQGPYHGRRACRDITQQKTA